MPLRSLLWIVLALAGIGIACALGWWQLDRARQKVALQAARDARLAEPPLAMSQLPRTADAARAQQHRTVVLQGHWLGRHTVYLDNRVMAGRTGFLALTPLALPDGSAVLVQRGWMPRDLVDPRRITRPLPSAEEPAQLRGRIALEAVQMFDLGQGHSGTIRQNVQVQDFGAETGLKLLPWVLVQEDEPAARGAAASSADGLLRQWSAPASDVHKHYGYAFQWFALAALIGFLYVWLRFIRSRSR
jgi:surfeit locus 1 family protein